MSGATGSVAARHAAAATRARAWLAALAAARPDLAGRLAGAAVWVVGAHALTDAPGSAPLEIEAVRPAAVTGSGPSAAAGTLEVRDAGGTSPAERAARAVEAAGTLEVRDAGGRLGGGAAPAGRGLAVRLRLRGADGLAACLAEPGGLWLRQRAAVVADPTDLLGAAMREALAAFRARAVALLTARYAEFTEGLERAAASRDRLARSLLLAAAARAALELPYLARGEPYPPLEWLTGYLPPPSPAASELVALSGRLVSAAGPDPEALAALRHRVEELLQASGAGPALLGQRALDL